MHSLLVLNTHLASSFWYEYYFKSTKKKLQNGKSTKKNINIGVGESIINSMFVISKTRNLWE